MNSEIQLAFAHPDVRAGVTTGTDMPDRISLRDHVVEVDIGAFQQERGHRQRVRFNVVVEVRPATEPLADDVDRILSYDKITEAISTELAAERLNLLETLAERVAERVLLEPAALRVFVRIEKLDVGPYALGVEIVRARNPKAHAALEPDVSHPVVVLLDNATIASADLAGRLDAWQAMGRPVVLVVGLPEMARPATGHKPTQRRIDLLAIEQNAWVLAARDARCVVVETRTEIDWAMRQGRMVVWAPSKLVLDSVTGPATQDVETLAVWLADTLNADRLIVHGDVSIPAESRTPVIRA